MNNQTLEEQNKYWNIKPIYKKKQTMLSQELNFYIPEKWDYNMDI